MIRKLSDTEFEFASPDDSSRSISIDTYMDGLVIAGCEMLTWENISKAREAVGLVSFEDEEFEKWAEENGYIKVIEPNAKPYSLQYLSARLDAQTIVMKQLDEKDDNEVFHKINRIFEYLNNTLDNMMEENSNNEQHTKP